MASIEPIKTSRIELRDADVGRVHCARPQGYVVVRARTRRGRGVLRAKSRRERQAPDARPPRRASYASTPPRAPSSIGARAVAQRLRGAVQLCAGRGGLPATAAAAHCGDDAGRGRAFRTRRLFEVVPCARSRAPVKPNHRTRLLSGDGLLGDASIAVGERMTRQRARSFSPARRVAPL